jgi:hypothetical protein
MRVRSVADNRSRFGCEQQTPQETPAVVGRRRVTRLMRHRFKGRFRAIHLSRPGTPAYGTAVFPDMFRILPAATAAPFAAGER